MDKYGLSFHEANKILIHLEKEEKVKNNSKGSLKKQDDNSNIPVSKPISNFKNDTTAVNDQLDLERKNDTVSKEQKILIMKIQFLLKISQLGIKRLIISLKILYQIIISRFQ